MNADHQAAVAVQPPHYAGRCRDADPADSAAANAAGIYLMGSVAGALDGAGQRLTSVVAVVLYGATAYGQWLLMRRRLLARAGRGAVHA